MKEILQHYIINQLGKDNLELVMSKFKRVTVKRNTYLLRQGEVCRYLYFVAEGCLQSYVLDSTMRENTREIITEGNWYSDLRSFIKREPSTEAIRALERCDLFQIGREDFHELMETIPQFGKVYQKILEAYYTNAVYRVNTFISLSALDRMKWLKQYRPALLTRLSGKLIASYLGINKDVFSRLKAKL